MKTATRLAVSVPLLFVMSVVFVLACGGGGASSPGPNRGTGGSTGGAGSAGTGGARGGIGLPPGLGGLSGGATAGASGGTGTASGGVSGGLGGAGTVMPGPIMGQRIISGPTVLVSTGVPCSYVPGGATAASADRWCAIFRVGATANAIALWVFNASKAIAGTAVTCDGSDPSCFQLTGNVSDTSAEPEAAHGFFGETLIYYDAQGAYAWRPGWSAGRRISTRTPRTTCIGGARAATVLCLKETTAATTMDLFAGTIDAPTGAEPALIERISTDGMVQLAVDDKSVLWSTRTTATAPEVLKLQTIGGATSTRQTVASNVTQWMQSADGQRWFWLAQPTTTPDGITTGTLQTAPFPAGTSPQTVTAGVLMYAPWGPSGVTLLANPGTNGADVKSIANVANPAAAVTVEAGTALGLVAIAENGAVVYATDLVEPDPMDPSSVLVNLLTANAAGAGKCTVTAAPEAAPDVALLRTTGIGLTWIRVTAAAVAAVYTTLPGCQSRTVSTTIAGISDVDAGLVVRENLDAQNGTAALGFAPFGADGAPGALVRIHGAADQPIMALFPAVPRILFTDTLSAATAGVYVSAPLSGMTAQLAFAEGGAGASFARGLPRLAVRPIRGLRPGTTAAVRSRLGSSMQSLTVDGHGAAGIRLLSGAARVSASADRRRVVSSFAALRGLRGALPD